MEKLSESLENRGTKGNLSKRRNLAYVVIVCLVFGGMVALLYVETPVGGGIEAGNSLVNIEKNDPLLIQVQIDGAVVSPGVYSLKTGSNISDLIEVAGGFIPVSDKELISTQIGLGTALEDGDLLYIPKIGEFPQNTVFNINKATVDDIVGAQFYRVGPKTAKAIVEYRDNFGFFSSFDDLLKVEGVGEVIIHKMMDRVVFDD